MRYYYYKSNSPSSSEKGLELRSLTCPMTASVKNTSISQCRKFQQKISILRKQQIYSIFILNTVFIGNRNFFCLNVLIIPIWFILIKILLVWLLYITFAFFVPFFLKQVFSFHVLTYLHISVSHIVYTFLPPPFLTICSLSTYLLVLLSYY